MAQHDKNYDFMENPIEPYIYSHFIKYDKLNEICANSFRDYKDNEILIFIDLYSLLLPLFRTYNTTNKLSVTSCIINMAIHYRNFFKKNGIYSHIFLLYSPTMGPSNLKYIPEYNSKNITMMMNNKDMFDAINQNLNLIGLIAPYLPDIYFKIGSVETTVMAYDIITKLYSKGFTKKPVFITSSQYSLQLPGCIPETLILYRKKNKNGEELSYPVDISNAMDSVLEESKKTKVVSMVMNPTWVSPFFTLCGLAQRSLKIIYNYKTGLNILSSIENSYNVITPETLFDAIIRNNKLSNSVSIEKIVMRFKGLDLNFQLAEYRTLPESRELAFMRQVNDFDQLLKINNQYFQNNPINLDML